MSKGFTNRHVTQDEQTFWGNKKSMETAERNRRKLAFDLGLKQDISGSGECAVSPGHENRNFLGDVGYSCVFEEKSVEAGSFCKETYPSSQDPIVLTGHPQSPITLPY